MDGARYDIVAGSYAPSDADLDRPVAVSLLGLAAVAADERALDLACGDGLIARELARRGADVAGLDLSPRLIERAQQYETESPLNISYVEGNAAEDAFENDVFDLVVCHFGLSDIDDLEGTACNVARWLRPGGRFVFSILHPCFGGGDGASGSWPSDGSYRDEGWWRATGALSTLRQKVGATHRMLSSYVNTLAAHGLLIDAVNEPPAEAAWSENCPAAVRQPVYLVVLCRAL